MTHYLVFACVGLLMGSVSFSRLFKLPAAALMALNVAKGALPVLLASSAGLSSLGNLFAVDFSGEATRLPWVTAFFVTLGHCYPIFYRFKGEAGEHPVLGILLVLSPWAAVGGVVGYEIAHFFKKEPVVCSLFGLMTATLVYLVIHPLGAELWWGLLILFVVLLSRDQEIDRVLAAEERQLAR